MTNPTAPGLDVHTPTSASRSRIGVIVAAAGLSLGAFAFAADFVPGVVGAVLTGLASSGAAWGAPAAIVGFLSRGKRDAIVRPALMLLIATTVYYLGILILSRRWNIAGESLTSGESTALIGLVSVGRLWVIWLIIALAIGATLGLLGYFIRHASPRAAAVAAGAATGLLLSEGLSAALWSLPSYWNLAEPGSSRPVSLLVAMFAAVVVPAVLAVTRRKPVAWWLYAIATVSIALATAGAWHFVEIFRNS